MEWSDEVIGQLRELWAEGHSTAEIGRRLGVTKNAIVGKAHRLDLPARPSPIRRDPNAAPTRRPIVRRVEGPTLPPLASATGEPEMRVIATLPTAPSGPQPAQPAVAPPVAAAAPAPAQGIRPPAPRPVPSVSPAAPPVAVRVAAMPPPQPRPVVPPPRPVINPPPRPVAATPRPYGRIVTCCWPLGEPGTRDFHFCDAPSEPGRPYCEDHVKVAYVRVRDRREDAA